jgi:hypothetical protein
LKLVNRDKVHKFESVNYTGVEYVTSITENKRSNIRGGDILLDPYPIATVGARHLNT